MVIWSGSMIQLLKGQKPVKFRKQWVGPYFIRRKKGMLFELKDLKRAEIKGLFNPAKLKQVNEERPQQNQSVLIDDA